MTTVGAGLSAGRNCAPSSAPNTGTEGKKMENSPCVRNFYQTPLKKSRDSKQEKLNSILFGALNLLYFQGLK